MSILYAVEAAMILAGFVAMFWLRRVGYRNWRREQQRRQAARIGVRLAAVSVASSAITPAMGKAVAAAADFERALRRAEAAGGGDR